MIPSKVPIHADSGQIERLQLPFLGLFDYVVAQARLRYSRIATGRFGADMKVSLVNDGPVTFWLRVAPPDR